MKSSRIFIILPMPYFCLPARKGSVFPFWKPRFQTCQFFVRIFRRCEISAVLMHLIFHPMMIQKRLQTSLPISFPPILFFDCAPMCADNIAGKGFTHGTLRHFSWGEHQEFYEDLTKK